MNWYSYERKKPTDFSVFALQNIYTNKTKSLSLLQKLTGFLLKFTEVEYHIRS